MKLKNNTLKTGKMKCFFHMACDFTMYLNAKKVGKARTRDEEWGRNYRTSHSSRTHQYLLVKNKEREKKTPTNQNNCWKRAIL